MDVHNKICRLNVETKIHGEVQFLNWISAGLLFVVWPYKLNSEYDNLLLDFMFQLLSDMDKIQMGLFGVFC